MGVLPALAAGYRLPSRAQTGIKAALCSGPKPPERRKPLI
jgi:hypothetical protein